MNRPTRPGLLDLQQPPPLPPPLPPPQQQQKQKQQQQQQQQQQHTVQRSKSNASLEGPPSSHGSSTLVSMGCPLASVSPESAYIAASAATGIVTSNHADFLQGEGGRAPTILVTAPSLKLINQFLDFLLYSFLSSAKSTSLRELRPAVEQVLRSRLAKEAVAGADHELTSYLGGGDGEEDDFEELQGGIGVWDLEATWKKTRLRCMVYSSLGDLEEEDEAVYSEADLEGSVGAQQYKPHSETLGVVSPPVAIWLTAVLEFVGEQTLLVAGHAAINRFTQKPHAEAAELADSCERPMVEELDTEKVALNPSLGRLWRQWRKRVRGRSSFSIPAFQRHERRASNSSRASASSFQPAENLPETRDALQAATERVDKLQQAALEVGIDTATIEEASEPALLSPVEGTPPQTGRTIAEAKLLDSDDLMEKPRPQSLVVFPWVTAESPFVPRSPVPSRPRSMPELTRRKFPQPVAATSAEELEEDEPDRAESDPSTQGLHERPVEPIQESDPLVKIDDRPGGSEVDEGSNFVAIQAKQAERAASPETEDNATAPENVESPNEEIGLARTSDTIVESPGSLSPRIHPSSENKAMNRLQQGELADRAPITTGNHPKGPSLAHRSTESPRPTGYHPPDISRGVTGSQNEVADTASDGCWPIATSPKGSRSEVCGHPTAIPIGNENTLYSPKDSLEISKHSQPSQRSDKRLGQFPLLQPSSSSSVSISSERANGLRVWTPPATPDKSRRSSSFSKVQRPIYTSGSTTSQSSTKFKSLVPWPVATAGQSKESDDESRSSLHSEKQSQRFADMDERERSFEELISRTDTIHCTITPDPIRRIEGFPHSKTQTADLADFLRNTGPDGMDPPRTLASSRPGSSRPGSRPSTGKAVAIVLKDPNAEDGISLSQLLRSPPSPSALAAPLPSPRSVGKSNQATAMHGASGSILRTGSPRVEAPLPPSLPPQVTISLPMVIKQYGADSQSTHSRPKNRLIARDASGATTNASTTSALIDFFRTTTPPVDGGQIAQRRISRSVAPFRNTMDSEEFDAVRDPSPQTEGSATNDLASFVVNSAPEDSYQSSFSSSTTLLRSNSRKTHDYGGAASSSTPAPMPTQHRSRDPYAIDFDDDTDIDGLDLILPRQKEEESLIDFLRNVPPPPAPPTPPEEKMVQKKNSSVSLIGRFGRTSARKNSLVSTSEGASPGVSAKHIPILADTDYMSHRYHTPSSAPYDYHRQTSDLRDPPNRGTIGERSLQVRMYQQKPRGARAERGNTDSLVEFLKDPPPPSQISPTIVKEEGGPSKFKISFGGKKVKRGEVF